MDKKFTKPKKEFKIEIGQAFKDEKRNLVVTDREYREKIKKNRKWKENAKWYRYTCNVCGWTEGWIEESNLRKGNGCACCRGLVVVEGINDIPTTAPWMVKYFQGGYNEAKLYTCNSAKRLNFKCIHCGEIKKKEMTINQFYIRKSIGCICSDKASYPEKFVHNVLKQLGVDFATQCSNKELNWCDKYRYDFYLLDCNCIIETHGEQHYKYTGRGRALEEEQENDKIKRELALENDISHYIVLDCRKSTLEWIKNSVLSSKLNELFDLSKIDWLKAEEFAVDSNKIKEICNYWNNKQEWETTVDLGEIFNCDYVTIDAYLKKGENLGWVVEYKKKKIKSATTKIGRNNRERCAKAVEVFRGSTSLGVFEAIADIVRQSEELFGTKMSSGHISQVCKGKRKHHKGFTFRYVEE